MMSVFKIQLFLVTACNTSVLGREYTCETVETVRINLVLSLTPDLSQVLMRRYKFMNRFNGF